MNSPDADPASASGALPPRQVLVVYESSVDGRAALSYAEGVASAAGAPLTVVAAVPHERVDVGCARCRQSAVIWNHELGEIANEELSEAAGLLDESTAVGYDIARGAWTRAVADAAIRCGADLIVVASRRPGRNRRIFVRDREEPLRRAGSWQVVVAPPATESHGVGITPARHAAQRERAAASATKSRRVRSGGSSGSG